MNSHAPSRFQSVREMPAEARIGPPLNRMKPISQGEMQRYPSIASRLSLGLYNATQSRIHVIVTYGFLRSLVRLDLAESRVGRFAPEQ